MKKADFYNEINAVNLSKDDMRRINKMVEMVKDKNIKSILDIGGNPKMTKIFSDVLNCGDSICVNISKKTLLNNKVKNVKLILGDIERIELKKKFDLIICAEVMEHLENVDIILEKIKKNLKKNGYILLTIPNLASLFNRISLLFGWQPRGINPSRKILLNPFVKYDYNWGHISMFTYYSIEKFLKKNGFKILKIKGTYGGHEGENKLRKIIRKIMNIKTSLSEQLIILAKIV